MEIAPKTVVVGERKYQVYQITGRRVMEVERKANAIIADLIGSSVDRNSMKNTVVRIFGSMSSDEFENVVLDTLVGVVYCGEDGNPPMKLNPDNVWDHFKGALDDLYSLVFECWEVYGITPFAKMAKAKEKEMAKEATVATGG